MAIKWTALTAVMLMTGIAAAAEKRGGLVLQFDDGWTSWATLTAPEIQRVKGVATGFVNNQNIRSGRITKEDLLTLQNTYHWEIGTHTWHHINAPSYVRKSGLESWVKQELVQSITELRGLGLTVHSLVFPFNAYTPELARAVQPFVETYRRSEPLAVTESLASDKSIPGTGIDIANYVPPDLLKRWVDLAVQRNAFLLLYGHRILPDTEFATGVVASVTATSLTAQAAVVLPQGANFVLVPDISRRPALPDCFTVLRVSGRTIEVDHPDLVANTKPGAAFMIGQSYSTRLSDFRTLLDYAAERMNFYTLHDVATKRP